MIQDLPSQLLRSFVTVVDCRSLAIAAPRLGRSESAISLQMARLEKLVGQALFDRDGRGLKVNQTGNLLLMHARMILEKIDAARAELDAAGTAYFRIGVVQDFVGAVLKPALSDINRTHPGATVSIIVAGTSELLKALSEEKIDVALCASEPISGTPSITLPMRWFGDIGLTDGDVVPLIGITGFCPFMVAAKNALTAAGRSWHVVLETPSLEGVQAAVEAGLGLTCRTKLGINLPPIEEGLLPNLPSAPYSIIKRNSPRKDAALAAELITRHLNLMNVAR
ncbi:LysR family transcriptional regulator [Agrobacterium larrymoorei]|uniref:LysR family transcriptional regulator n=1 Tax=Agrobacterium larrymoorei TaxID=160699 RepID=A0A4D7DRR7_9HYPH|nr:LysR family transcriptional regulator [Agrobacterium larrymoorei]QCI98367.1 LysR family transcriptional regulator [Agrobacterium larrymoorei]QYA06176.1 LysR family transcriptional regulator [Agrobacterium larrymoorei]